MGELRYCLCCCCPAPEGKGGRLGRREGFDPAKARMRLAGLQRRIKVMARRVVALGQGALAPGLQLEGGRLLGQGWQFPVVVGRCSRLGGGPWLTGGQGLVSVDANLAYTGF